MDQFSLHDLLTPKHLLILLLIVLLVLATNNLRELITRPRAGERQHMLAAAVQRLLIHLGK
jgi:hypothetical protein